jgi:hypothetical protein
VTLGWKKLHSYYELSDHAPAYRVAIALHPAFKSAWFRKHWLTSHLIWIDKAVAATRSMCNVHVREHKKQNKSSREDTSETRELSRLDRYNHINDEGTESLDELTRYLAAPVEKVDNPIVW